MLTIITKRMAEQQGVFTIQGNPLLDIRTVAHGRLHVHEVHAEARRDILIDLFRLGISASSLFRDLQGVAESARWVHEQYVPTMASSHRAEG